MENILGGILQNTSMDENSTVAMEIPVATW